MNKKKIWKGKEKIEDFGGLVRERHYSNFRFTAAFFIFSMNSYASFCFVLLLRIFYIFLRYLQAFEVKKVLKEIFLSIWLSDWKRVCVSLVMRWFFAFVWGYGQLEMEINSCGKRNGWKKCKIVRIRAIRLVDL